MSANGYLKPSELTTVQSGIQLSKKTAIAWFKLKAAARSELGRSISIATPAGGYRSFFVQGDMKRRPWLYNLNPASGASLAAPGYSKHGLGTCVDIVGTALDERFFALARKYGFTRPLPDDPNHFLQDGHTAVTTPPIHKPNSKKVYYTIKSGDTLSEVAELYHLSLLAIEKLNPSIKNVNVVKVGQKIRVA